MIRADKVGALRTPPDPFVLRLVTVVQAQRQRAGEDGDRGREGEGVGGAVGAWGRDAPALAPVGPQHALRTLDALTEAVLKFSILLALCDVLFDRRADYLRDWLAVNSSDGVQFLSLLCGQANRHCLWCIHRRIVRS